MFTTVDNRENKDYKFFQDAFEYFLDTNNLYIVHRENPYYGFNFVCPKSESDCKSCLNEIVEVLRSGYYDDSTTVSLIRKVFEDRKLIEKRPVKNRVSSTNINPPTN